MEQRAFALPAAVAFRTFPRRSNIRARILPNRPANCKP